MRISRTRDVKLPVRGTAKSAGVDFFIPKFDEKFIEDLTNANKLHGVDISTTNKSILLKPQQSVVIPSGVYVDMPEGYAFIAHNKSGIGSKKRLDRLAEVIDEDYQGEIHLNVINVSNKDVVLGEDEKLIQFIMIPVLYCGIDEVPFDTLYSEESERGSGAFGSTNK